MIPGIDAVTLSDAKEKANEIKRNTVFNGYDREDIEQDLLLHLWEVKGAFDPARGSWRAFSRTVLRNKGFRMIGERSTEKETIRRRSRSLDEVIGSDEAGAGSSLADSVTDSRPGIAAEVRFHIDYTAAFSALPADLQGLAKRLETCSQTALAAELGIPRTTFRDRYLIPIQNGLRMAL